MTHQVNKNELDEKSGRVEWIGVRPGRREDVISVKDVDAVQDSGLHGDHYAGRTGSSRQVSLIQHEDIAMIASALGAESVDPRLLRRNIAVSGIKLESLRERRFRIGDAVFEGSGACRPCSRMEENLGDGGIRAMSGRGGITARVIRSGNISIGDEVQDVGPAREPGVN